MNELEQLNLDIKSILVNWPQEGNKEKVAEYVRSHKWLQADIEKLNGIIERYQLVRVAITKKLICGTTATGNLFFVDRLDCGIQGNYE